LLEEPSKGGSLTTVRALLFDAGFTLIRPKRSIAELLVDVVRRRGHRAEAEALEAAIPPFEPFLDRFQADGDLVFASDARTTALWHAYYRAVLNQGAAHLSEEEIAACASEVADLYGLPELWEPYPEVEATLAEGRRRGLVQGVVSDWGSRLTPILHGLGLTQQLDFVVVSAVVGAAKPNGLLFDLAVRRAGVANHEVVYVGDSYRSDVLGGRGAGIVSILLDRGGVVERVDGPLIRRLDEVFSIIDDIQKKQPAVSLKHERRRPIATHLDIARLVDD
jgi:putative hydrolase of the HAD superfamily